MSDIEPNSKLLPLSPDRVSQAYQGKDEALAALPEIPPDFEPVFSQAEIGINPDKNAAWEVSTKLAWALRIADSQKNKEVCDEILNAVKIKPRMELYATYQLLSDSFENEKDFETMGYTLNPLSKDLHDFAFKTMKNGLEKTQDPKELTMFKYVAARVADWIRELGYGSTYLGGNEVLDLLKILKDREATGDTFLTSGEGAEVMSAITQSTARIPSQTLQ